MSLDERQLGHTVFMLDLTKYLFMFGTYIGSSVILQNEKEYFFYLSCFFLMPLKIAHIQLLIVSQITRNTFV